MQREGRVLDRILSLEGLATIWWLIIPNPFHVGGNRILNYDIHFASDSTVVIKLQIA